VAELVMASSAWCVTRGFASKPSSRHCDLRAKYEGTNAKLHNTQSLLTSQHLLLVKKEKRKYNKLNTQRYNVSDI
jgi:hypothetical protein